MNTKSARVINLDVDQHTLECIRVLCLSSGCDVDQLVGSLLENYVREQSWRLDHQDFRAA
jgi:hypothetical protein